MNNQEIPQHIKEAIEKEADKVWNEGFFAFRSELKEQALHFAQIALSASKYDGEQELVEQMTVAVLSGYEGDEMNEDAVFDAGVAVSACASISLKREAAKDEEIEMLKEALGKIVREVDEFMPHEDCHSGTLAAIKVFASAALSTNNQTTS